MVPRIQQIQIRNFRSIERAVVDLEPLTVLVGANGSGKSNFLRALTFARDCLVRSPAEAARLQGGPGLVPRWETPATGTGIRFHIDLGDGRVAHYAFELAFDRSSPRIVTHELCQIFRTGREESGFEVVRGEFKREIEGIRAQIQRDRLALVAASATEEFRAVYDFLAGVEFYAIDPVEIRAENTGAWGHSLDSHGANAAEILYRISQQPGQAVLQSINALLSMAVPGLQAVDPLLEREQESLIFQHEGPGSKAIFFKVGEMSEGTLRLLGLLLAVYQPEQHSVLCIEEPEATVHPAAAELVLQVLQDAAHDRQVLITTHSPDLLDAKDLSDEQIRVVTMTQGRTSIAPLSHASRQAIREHLFTPGELLRSDELRQDGEAAAASADRLDLFAEAPLRE